ncbi:TetR/AcrR family transcriptional regulator [Rhodanobacter geophilus]|uniref:TetR/AcrR family transcriptional regulator n=1 Tax=Rhodanobacter geophilus TaxID=3162488 RepID=A0ABV3QMD1_9GAMM
MRYSSEHKQQTREKVLTAAARTIREQGPERISVAAVMGEAGLTHGGFYAHFASKEALVAASIEHMFEQMRARIDELTEGRGAREALRNYIDFYLSERHVQARGQGCPVAALGSDLPRLDDAARKAFADGMAIQHRRLRAFFKSLDVADPDDSAHSLRSELLGALLSARLVSAGERKKVLEASRQSLKRRFDLMAS